MHDVFGLKFLKQYKLDMRFTDINVTQDIHIGDYYSKKIPLTVHRFQIPRMYMPFGVSGFVPEIGPTKYNVDFSMKGWNDDGNYVNEFYKFVKSIEDRVIKTVFDNSVEIFGTQLNTVQLNNMFKSNIKETSDREPKFRIKIDDNTRVFDANNEDVTCELSNGLYQKHSGVGMVEFGGVYFLNRMFGITWKMCQMKIFEPQRLKGFQFQLEESDDY
jgi:hypothetical protein